jgi:hypothetical protein
MVWHIRRVNRAKQNRIKTDKVLRPIGWHQCALALVTVGAPAKMRYIKPECSRSFSQGMQRAQTRINNLNINAITRNRRKLRGFDQFTF